MTKNQLAAYFSPSAPWATNPAVIPQTAASAKALGIVQQIIRQAVIELPGVAQIGSPNVPDVIYGVEDSLYQLYSAPQSYRLVVPVNVRRLCAAVVKKPCGAELARILSNPQAVQ